jgi:5-methylcytosine-specific restriction endonuclease McrA
MKTCSKCNETKPLDRFSKNRRSKDGLQVHCKSCEAAWYAANRERKAETGAAWHAANRERKAATNAAWYATNHERKAETGAAWYAANRERMAATVAAWKKANPDKVTAHSQRRRARKRNAAGTFTSEQWLARLAYHENKCVYCGSPDNLHIEHQIPLARGGTNWPSNLVPACGTCNRSKGTRTPKQFLAYRQKCDRV